jgi:hypothetical protein
MFLKGKSKIFPTVLVLCLAVPIVSALLLSSTATASSTTQQPAMVGSQWKVYEQNTLPNGNLHFYPATHADTIDTGGVEFSMPDAAGMPPTYVNYLLNTYTISLSESNTITATINVVTTCVVVTMTSPCPTTTFVGNPNGVLPQPITVRLFIQSNLPEDGSATCGVGHKNVDNYWWSVAPGSSYDFTNGGTVTTVTLKATLSPSNWSGICGNSGASDPASFAASISDIKYIGLSFGSGFFYANGMGVDGSTGMATFQLLSYTFS